MNKILKYSLLSFLISFLNLNADDTNILNNHKLNLLKYNSEQAKSNETKNNLSWIKDINIILQSNVGEFLNKNADYNKIGIYFDQEIFMGGNIYNGIKYSKLLNDYQQDMIKIEKEKYFYEILNNVLIIESLNLNLDKINLELESNEIDYKKKYSLYKEGLLNISFVSDLIIKKNVILNNKIELENKIELSKLKLKNYTYLKMKKLKQKIDFSKYLKIMTEEEYIKGNYIQVTRKKIDMKRLEEKISKNKFLPVVSIYGNAEYNDNSTFLPTKDYRTDYNYGFKIKIPLSINNYNDLEIKKNNYLVEKSNFIDEIQSEKIFYQQKIKEIESIYKKIKNIDKTIEEYSKLIDNLIEDNKIGLSISSDVELLKVLREIQIVNKKIYIHSIKEISLILNIKMFKGVK